MKRMLKKAKDPYLSLLAHRATPMDCGFSPSELLMGRRLRTNVPTHPVGPILRILDRGKGTRRLNSNSHTAYQKKLKSYNHSKMAHRYGSEAPTPQTRKASLLEWQIHHVPTFYGPKKKGQ